jgi:hypothetical protein
MMEHAPDNVMKVTARVTRRVTMRGVTRRVTIRVGIRVTTNGRKKLRSAPARSCHAVNVSHESGYGRLQGPKAEGGPYQEGPIGSLGPGP